MKRRILFSVMCAVITASVFAQGQGQGLAGINAATSLMTSYFDPATKLCYAIGAVLGLVGGIEIRGHEAGCLVDTRKALALRKGVCGDDRAHHRKKDSSFHCRIVWVRHKFEFDNKDKWG